MTRLSQKICFRNEELNTRLKHEIDKLNRLVVQTSSSNTGADGVAGDPDMKVTNAGDVPELVCAYLVEFGKCMLKVSYLPVVS